MLPVAGTALLAITVLALLLWRRQRTLASSMPGNASVCVAKYPPMHAKPGGATSGHKQAYTARCLLPGMRHQACAAGLADLEHEHGAAGQLQGQPTAIEAHAVSTTGHSSGGYVRLGGHSSSSTCAMKQPLFMDLVLGQDVMVSYKKAHPQ